MIAFSWRQFRSQAVVGVAGLLVVAIVLVITGPHLVNVYDTAVAACKASGGQSAACINPVTGTDKDLRHGLTALVLIVPALIGMFWGAPLIAHELETGTFRLAWTQSVSRLRWLLVKLGLVGLASMLAAGLLSLMVTWWVSPIDKVDQNRFAPSSFALHGFVPAGYAVFAFALAATLGLVVRRTVPAMAATLASFVGARLAVTYWLRPHYMSPVTTTLPLTPPTTGFQFSGPFSTPGSVNVNAQAPNLPNAWVTGASIVDKAGHAPTSAYVKQVCPGIFSLPAPDAKGGATTHGAAGILGGHSSVAKVPVSSQDAFNQCITTLSAKYHEVVAYQPAGRFWTFQAVETALFVAMAVALAGVCAWWVRHRIS
jgi:ABC-2 family transporter protein